MVLKLSRKEEVAIHEIFPDGARRSQETNATIVTLAVMQSLEKKRVIRYQELPELRERFGVLFWRVELTEAGATYLECQKPLPPFARIMGSRTPP